jgi:hypothetical protein
MAGPEESGFVAWVIAAILASAGVLTSAIAYLFKSTEFQNAKAIERLEKANAKCEEDRIELYRQLGLILQRIGEIDSKGTKYSRGQE